MPGRPGAYDLAAIAAWRDSQLLGRSAAGEAGELAKLEVQLKQLKLERERGDLVSAAAMSRLLTRHVHEAKARLSQLPDELLGALGSLIPRERMAELTAALRRRIDAACQALADLLAAEELPARVEGE